MTLYRVTAHLTSLVHSTATFEVEAQDAAMARALAAEMDDFGGLSWQESYAENEPLEFEVTEIQPTTHGAEQEGR